MIAKLPVSCWKASIFLNQILSRIKAYGTAKLRQYIEDKAGVYTIPPKENTKDKWTCDYHVYCERHLIENFFNQLKNFRRIATRYDKLAHVYLATVYIASICILLK